jgi:DNA polymerase III subunit delta'
MADASYELAAWDRIEGIPDPVENRQLVGHGATIDRLAEQYSGGRMHHAWLITGPRGIGKATLAARFAGHVFRYPEALRAPPSYIFPDENDPAERQIARGGHPNLLHMRRPWNERDKRWRRDLTVEEIRRTIGFFGTASAQTGWRVAIVDTADDLNRNAANALLKILEEPPPNTIFLVLAHSTRGMLATIRSRCQRLAMRPLAHDELKDALHRLGLGHELTSDEMALLAELSGGSVRRAIVILKENGLSLYRQFIELVEQTGEPDWTSIHRLASDISPVNRNEKYRLFFDLFHDFIVRRIRGKPEPGISSILQQKAGNVSLLAGWVEVWEKTQQSADQTDAYNLDRKQVILNLFSAIHEMV